MVSTYIALFRALNVGGSNILPMKALVHELGRLGCRSVKTYIQSGNAVFQHEETTAVLLAKKIGTALRESRGFEPQVLVLTLGELTAAMASNPFPEAESEPATLHLSFFASVPQRPDFDLLASVRSDNEHYALKGKVFYLHAPDGIGRSKLAARVEKALGVTATGRNWRSVCKIVDIARQCR